MDISLYARSPQIRSEEVSSPAAANINTVQSSGAGLENYAGFVSVYGDVPMHAALLDIRWAPVGN